MAKNNKIEDFGMKIGGARKDLYLRKGGLSINDLDTLDEREYEAHVKKDNVWPKPNYVEMLSEGYEPECIYYTKLVREALPSKPTRYTVESVRRYLETLHFYRAVCKDIKSTASLYSTEQIIKNKAQELGFTITREYNIGTLANLCFRDLEIIKSTVEIQGFPQNFSGALKGLAVREYVSGKFIIVKNNKRMYNFFKTYDSREEAMNVVREEVIPYLMNSKKDKKESHLQKYTRPQLEGIKRIGYDHRKGKDVTGEDILETFEFRGGEFGNWNTQADRQAVLNHAYDAFVDLMTLIHAPFNFASLGGYKGKKLAIAFGSRGIGAALAHYEPANVVINLTKMKGAGCLAHEWAHALDDFIGIKCGFSSLFTKEGTGFRRNSDNLKYSEIQEAFKDLIHTIKFTLCTDEEMIETKTTTANNYKSKVERLLKTFENVSIRSKGTIRQASEEEKNELIAAKQKLLKEMTSESLDELNKTHKKITNRLPSAELRNSLDAYTRWYTYSMSDINDIKAGTYTEKSFKDTEFHKKSKYLDKVTGKSYFSTATEMFARVFESYIEDTLAKHNLKSDYLVHSTSNSSYENFSPYPSGEERILFNQAMEKFLILVVSTFSEYIEYDNLKVMDNIHIADANEYNVLDNDVLSTTENNNTFEDNNATHTITSEVSNTLEIEDSEPLDENYLSNSIDKEETSESSSINTEEANKTSTNEIELVTEEELDLFLSAIGLDDDINLNTTEDDIDLYTTEDSPEVEFISKEELTTLVIEESTEFDETNGIDTSSEHDDNSEETDLETDAFIMNEEDCTATIDDNVVTTEVVVVEEEIVITSPNDNEIVEDIIPLEQDHDSNVKDDVKDIAPIHPQDDNTSSTCKEKSSNNTTNSNIKNPSLDMLLQLHKESTSKKSKSTKCNPKQYETFRIINNWI